MQAGPLARRPTLMRDGLEKSAHKFYAGWSNPHCHPYLYVMSSIFNVVSENLTNGNTLNFV